MSKPLRTGGEVDSWCTKCRLFLGHRIVAMVGPKPVKVECRTCGTHHAFRPNPPGTTAPKGESSGRAAREPSTRASRPPTRVQQAELEREQRWEKAIAGKAISDFKVYRVSNVFQEGELLRHSKFGDGVVTRILDPRKIEVLFKDETRTLAQGLTD